MMHATALLLTLACAHGLNTSSSELDELRDTASKQLLHTPTVVLATSTLESLPETTLITNLLQAGTKKDDTKKDDSKKDENKKKEDAKKEELEKEALKKRDINNAQAVASVSAGRFTPTGTLQLVRAQQSQNTSTGVPQQGDQSFSEAELKALKTFTSGNIGATTATAYTLSWGLMYTGLVGMWSSYKPSTAELERNNALTAPPAQWLTLLPWAQLGVALSMNMWAKLSTYRMALVMDDVVAELGEAVSSAPTIKANITATGPPVWVPALKLSSKWIEWLEYFCMFEGLKQVESMGAYTVPLAWRALLETSKEKDNVGGKVPSLQKFQMVLGHLLVRKGTMAFSYILWAGALGMTKSWIKYSEMAKKTSVPIPMPLAKSLWKSYLVWAVGVNELTNSYTQWMEMEGQEISKLPQWKPMLTYRTGYLVGLMANTDAIESWQQFKAAKGGIGKVA